MITYVVDGVGGGGNFAVINDACTEIATTHDYSVDGMAIISYEHSGADTTPVTIGPASAGTPSASAHIRVEVASAHRNTTGGYNTGKARLETTSGHSVTITEDWVHWKGVQIKNAATGGSSLECVRTTADKTLVEKCWLYNTRQESQSDGLYIGSTAASDTYVFDCAMHMRDIGRNAIHAQTQGTAANDLYVEHCTLVGNVSAIALDRKAEANTIAAEVYNTIAAVGSAACYEPQSGSSWAGTFTGKGVLSEDTSAETEFGAGNGNVNSAEWSETDTAGKEVYITEFSRPASSPPDPDFTLNEGVNTSDDAVQNAQTGSVFQIGTDASAARVDLTTDIAGNARPATYTDRDCGCFQASVPSGPAGGITTLFNSKYGYRVFSRPTNFSHYFDQISGSNANPGTLASPWRDHPASTLFTGSYTPARGDSFGCLAQGKALGVVATSKLVFDVAGGWDVFDKNYPCITASVNYGERHTYEQYYEYATGDFSDVGQPTNIYKASEKNGNEHTRVMFATSGTDLWGGLKQASKAACVADGDWFHNTVTSDPPEDDDNSLFIYSSGGNPITALGAYVFATVNLSSLACIDIQDTCTDIVVFDAECYGGFEQIKIAPTATESGIIDCIGRGMGQTMISMGIQADANAPDNSLIEHCLADFKFGSTEYDDSANFGGFDGIEVRGDNSLVRYNQIIDAGHTALRVNSDTTGHSTDNNIIEHNTTSMVNAGYGRALAVTGYASAGNIVRSNLFDGMRRRSQIRGAGTKVYFNVFKDHIRGAGDSIGGECLNINHNGTDTRNQASDIVVAWNVFDGSEDPGISLQTQNTGALNLCEIKNNIFMRCGSLVGDVAIYLDDASGAIATQDFQANYFNTGQRIKLRDDSIVTPLTVNAEADFATQFEAAITSDVDGGYRITDTSEMATGAVAVTGVTWGFDYTGRPTTGAHIGASEPYVTTVINRYILPDGASVEYAEAGVPYSIPLGLVYSEAEGLNLVGVASITGSVDTNTLGSNIVTYSFPGAVNVTLPVIVRDTIKPVITVAGDTIDRTFSYVVNTAQVMQLNPTATDSFEGSLPVVQTGDTLDLNTIGTYVNYFDCSDSSGNAARQVVVTYNIVADITDVTPPVITLTHDELTWPTGVPLSNAEAFVAIGPSANDDQDGPIELTSANTVVTGVDVNTPGVYSDPNGIVVTAQDSASPPNVATEIVPVTIAGQAASTLLETSVLRGREGAAVTTPYVTTGLPIKPGLLDPLTQTIEVRKPVGADVFVIPCQVDGEVTKATDGTVNFCQVAFKGVTLGVDQEQNYTIHIIAGEKNTDFQSGETEAASKAAITGTTDYKVILSNGVTGTSSLNDMLGLSTTRMIRSGPLLREWVGFDKVDTHADLYVRWYVRLNSDDTIEFDAVLCNGWTPDDSATVSDYTFDWSLQEGATVIRTGNINIAHGQWLDLCGADGLWENQGNYILAHETDGNGAKNYLQTTYCFLPYGATAAAVIAAHQTSNPLAYAYNGSYGQDYAGNILKAMGTTGERDDICSILTKWSTVALIAQEWSTDQIDRVNGLYMGHALQGLREPLTGEISITNKGSYAADGMGSVDRSYIDPQNTYTQVFTDGWTDDSNDASHHPELNFSQYAMRGDVRFLELHMNTASALSMQGDPSFRNGLVVDGVTYDGIACGKAQWQERAQANLLRTLGNLYWICPDDHPARNYITDRLEQEWAYFDAVMKTAEASGGHFDGLRAMGAYRTTFDENGQEELLQNVISPWQQDFIAMAGGLGRLRGYVPETWMTNKFTKFNTARAVDGCQKFAYPYRLRIYRPGVVAGDYATDWDDVVGTNDDDNLMLHSMGPTGCPSEGLYFHGIEDNPANGGVGQNPYGSGATWYAAPGHAVASIAYYLTTEGIGSYPHGEAIHNYLQNYLDNPPAAIVALGGAYLPATEADFASNPKYNIRNPVTPPVEGLNFYSELRALSGSVGQTETIVAPGIAGNFDWSASDPYSNGDDGGIVIQAANGWWVRDFAHTLADPVQLNWFEVVNNQSIDALLKQIADMFAPNMYVKMPDTAMNLNWTGSGVYDWTVTDGITSFALLESDAATSLSFTHASTVNNWRWGDMDVMILGTDQSKAQDDYNLTLRGSWTPSNRARTDQPGGSAIVSVTGALQWKQTVNNNTTGHFRCHTTKFHSASIRVLGNGNKNIEFAGKHTYGSKLDVGGEVTGYVLFDDVYVSDEIGRGVGWDGALDGNDLDRTRSHWRGTLVSVVRNGGSNSGATLTMLGKLTQQYGGGASAFFFIDKCGTSMSDPFVYNVKDYNWSGPNEYTSGALWNAGVELGNFYSDQQPYKSDGMGEDTPNVRFWKVTEENQWGANDEYNGAPRMYFGENEACDDVPPPCTGVFTREMQWIWQNVQGRARYKNGDNAIDSIERNTHQGDGINPAFLDSELQLTWGDTVRYGQFHDITIKSDLAGTARPWGDDNTLHDISITGVLDVKSGNNNTLTDVKIMGSPRDCITLSGGELDIVNIHADTGAGDFKITGSGTVTINGGAPVSLPYTILAGDANGADPGAIPPNPLIT